MAEKISSLVDSLMDVAAYSCTFAGTGVPDTINARLSLTASTFAPI